VPAQRRSQQLQADLVRGVSPSKAFTGDVREVCSHVAIFREDLV